MKRPEEQEFARYVERIAAKTNEGTMKWTRSNPTTFTWTKRDPRTGKGARLTVQKIPKRMPVKTERGTLRVERVDHYIFQALELPTRSQMVSINSADSPDFREILEKLYDMLTLNISRRGLDFLRDVVED